METKINKTKCPTYDDVVVSLCENNEQVGIIKIRIFKDGKYKGEAYLWNIYIDKEHRGKGGGRTLLYKAIDISRQAGCEKATLDWNNKEFPNWVFDWYVRNGFKEEKFGDDWAFMAKKLKEIAE